ncbi:MULTISPECIES: 3-hydroxyacyl-CoA dehydrogenase family protein [unclassified Modestobacter]|uniref:3-hydroxyacyl-CoA dehydrogenase family protein n=1 Tax=unclassified Modestobacter TaxID=2643866 RepID=UPI0022AB299F|nr:MULTISPECIES: 3-hydroxyacyl-CoA dehydrogenase family protein [unclassified Modestobacter]MCZ2810861.1 3-hydroxyacyl-CoA dehydrogenase family protein [Modestobacter sp. VKM Ac-2979]MCZ2840374.1 3-hydroxyacyl-CoA dehydrogenase family protein [Modestobacter sp. VKM Ac-2980]MCZ2849502.1 3-hydroxyacyl-CoA dehydrogenase family protein [Modestobacter sp. VKM Ac-2978]
MHPQDAPPTSDGTGTDRTSSERTSTALPEQVGVIGGGRMGAGIAQAFLVAGARVEVVEAGDEAAEAARGRVSAGLEEAARRGKLRGEVAEVLDRLTLVDSPTDLTADAGLVVEAVPERADLKVAVLTAAEAVLGPDAVLATNTSSLSVTELAAALQRPTRFLGLHFFNPVPASKLVEVVVAPETAEDVVAASRDWVRALGKTDVVVRDSPGFASSRLGVLLGLEAIRMLEEGVADAEAIDAAMELGYRHPMGPLRSTDLVGLDVRLAIAEYLAGTLGERFTPPQLLRDKVAAGELGRKTGRGFHDYAED